jgi:hypothetical protein
LVSATPVTLLLAVVAGQTTIAAPVAVAVATLTVAVVPTPVATATSPIRYGLAGAWLPGEPAAACPAAARGGRPARHNKAAVAAVAADPYMKLRLDTSGPAAAGLPLARFCHACSDTASIQVRAAPGDPVTSAWSCRIAPYPWLRAWTRR